MKKIFLLILLFAATIISAQTKSIKKQVVEASCGECQFGMKGKGCDLAVKIDGKNYFVDGTSIDSHGDAHATDGFCAAVRKAIVSGEIINDRFVVKTFVLVPDKN